MASGFEASDAFQAEIRADFSKKRIPKIISVSGVIGTDRHRAVNGEYTLTSGIEDWQLSYTHKTTSDLKLALEKTSQGEEGSAEFFRWRFYHNDGDIAYTGDVSYDDDWDNDVTTMMEGVKDCGLKHWGKVRGGTTQGHRN